jgi:riboflavin-specific deaminase-like protein
VTTNALTPMFDQLFPTPPTEDSAPLQVLEAITAEDRTPPASDRPWVYINMVSSLDGATALDGVSGGLGGAADKQVFNALRAQADIIIAGAETIRAESYHAPQTSPQVQAERVARGQNALPLIVVVSGSASLDPDLRLFDDPSYVPMLVTGTAANESRLAALETKMNIVRQKSDRVDLSEMLKMLASHGHKRCLVEGGPSLNGQFISDGLVDEWNMTLSPVVASGSSSRPAHGPTAAQGQRLDLLRLWHAEGLLFGRWVRGSF